MADLKKSSFLGGYKDKDEATKGSGISSGETQSMTTQPPVEGSVVTSKEGNVVTSKEGNVVTSKEGNVRPEGGDGKGVSISRQHSGAAEGKPKPLSRNQRRNLKKRQMKAAAAAMATSEAPAKEDSGCVKAVATAAVAMATSEAPAKEDSGCKRLVSDLIPSPKITVLAKKPREVSPTRAFADVAQHNRLAVVKDGFPTDKLTQAEYDLIYGDMTDRIDQIPRGRPLPKINSTNYIKGAMIISYVDSTTKNWIRTSLHGNTSILEGITLKVLAMSEMPKPVKVAFRIRDTYTKDPKRLLQRLARYNPKLKVDTWRVLNYISEAQSARWIFEVDTESADAIRRAGFLIYAGMDKGVFKILHDPNLKEDKKEEAQDAVTSTQSNTVPEYQPSSTNRHYITSTEESFLSQMETGESLSLLQHPLKTCFDRGGMEKPKTNELGFLSRGPGSCGSRFSGTCFDRGGMEKPKTNELGFLSRGPGSCGSRFSGGNTFNYRP